MKKGWADFLMQTFCYAALFPAATHVHIVLPLQEHIWSWDVQNEWPKRQLYLDVLKTLKVQNEEEEEIDALFAPLMFSNFPIGCHIAKKKSMRATLQGLSSFDRPYQLFFTKSTKFNMSDAEISESLDFITNSGTKLYVHSPYLLNLCMEPGPAEEPNYVVDCLVKHLQVSSAMGLKGVIVHVGKSVKMEHSVAMANMRANVLQCLAAATPECPLLLETPAGQGTETLTAMADFMGFVESVGDPRFSVCVDTCHSFASGTQPIDYLKGILTSPTWRPYLKLIHFNDSKTKYGSGVDRHAQLGTGFVTKDQLVECAVLATLNGIPMLVE
jgi:deoxyribonuclease-4